MSDEIHFRGEPILALNPAMNNTSVPAQYQSHALVRNQFFLTLPLRLWEILQRELRDNGIDSVNLELEHGLSRITGNHESNVGFWRNLPINYHLLAREPLAFPDAATLAAAGISMNAEQLKTATQRSFRFLLNARGYAGWLMTNRCFLEEHDDLVRQWSEQLLRWGPHMVGIPIPSHMPPGQFNPTSEPSWTDFQEVFLAFLVRWRLRGLAAPTLPIPIQPLMGGDFPVTILQQLIRAGGVFNWPDIAPIPSREELRDILEDALRGRESPEHLQGWMEIVAGNNTARNQIARYATIFELQHYWRVLCRRYPEIQEGNVERLRFAFAEFLEVSDGKIAADLSLIRDQLGTNWAQMAMLPTSSSCQS
jgi:hypothetical protein